MAEHLQILGLRLKRGASGMTSEKRAEAAEKIIARVSEEIPRKFTWITRMSPR